MLLYGGAARCPMLVGLAWLRSHSGLLVAGTLHDTARRRAPILDSGTKPCHSQHSASRCLAPVGCSRPAQLLAQVGGLRLPGCGLANQLNHKATLQQGVAQAALPRLGLWVIWRHAGAHEPKRRRQTVQDVHASALAIALEQLRACASSC